MDKQYPWQRRIGLWTNNTIDALLTVLANVKRGCWKDWKASRR